MYIRYARGRENPSQPMNLGWDLVICDKEWRREKDSKN